MERLKEYHGILLTIIVLALTQASALLLPIFSFTLAPAFVALIYTANYCSPWATVISAGLVGGYGFYALIDDPARAAVILISALAVAGLAIRQQLKAGLVDHLNGNIARLLRLSDVANDLLRQWAELNDAQRRHEVVILEDGISTLASLVRSWHTLYWERRIVIEEEEKRKRGA